MAPLGVEEHVFRAAGQVSAAFSLIIAGALIVQSVTRLRHQAQAQRRRERYVRSADKGMMVYDRIVGNLLEWALPFLINFWLSVVLTGGATLKLGWLYVASRALYPFVALAGRGIGEGGAKPAILLATVPAYVALIALAVPTWRALLA